MEINVKSKPAKGFRIIGQRQLFLRKYGKADKTQN